MARLKPESLLDIVNHVVLPPKLPQQAEAPAVSRIAERHLIKLLVIQVRAYRRHDSSDSDKTWSIITTMLERLADLLSTPSLSKNILVRSFASLEACDVLLIHLRAQNAVLILRKSVDAVAFECFEASPKAESVIAATGSLIRQFPAHALSIPVTVFEDHKFQVELAHRLAQLDVEVVEEMLPQSRKAGSEMGEVRDTAHPGLVTEMLMATLAPFGKPLKVTQLQKRTRDDVLWHNCLLPWRRSALWLAIRVTLQTTLIASLSSTQATIKYKNLMISLLTEIASRVSAAPLAGDLCHVIVAKIARRAFKLGQDVSNPIQMRALNVCQAIKREQEENWQMVQKSDADRSTTIGQWDFERDTALSLHESRPYLDSVLDQIHHLPQHQAPFVPTCRAWLKFSRGLPNIKGLRNGTTEEQTYGLSEFEAWIAKSLPEWRNQRLLIAPTDDSVAHDCQALATLATDYRDLTIPLYSHASEQMSNMLLVVAELWYALDVLAVKRLPLFGDYSPCIPDDFFSPLLLPKRNQMERLRAVELHITRRRALADSTNPSIFSDPSQRSIAVQYYASSLRHKALREKIEAEAEVDRQVKRNEWRDLSDTYDSLKDQAKAMSCQTERDWDGIEYHSTLCRKCSTNSQADSMMIDVHEWPLPSDETICQTAVVELDCPLELASWRNLTWMLVQDCGRKGENCGINPAAQLSTYAGLRAHARDKGSRITLASAIKAFTKAHYGQLKVSACTLDRCFVDNALRYQLFDPVISCWVEEQREGPNLHESCVTTLPNGPYANLQCFVDSVNHSQNQVIADQESCSDALNLHEFLSFGSLRADGERVQWHNIKRELAAYKLNFNTEAVCTLIIQAAWQTGSQAESVLRNSHLDIARPEFCNELLTNVTKVLESVQGNWKSDDAILSLIVIVLRVLSLCVESDVVDSAIDQLYKIRTVNRQWIIVLEQILRQATEPGHILKLQQRLLKTAIICKMTFDVDTQYLGRVMATDEDIRAWIVSSMCVRANYCGEIAQLPADVRRLLMRDMKLTHLLHRDICRLIVESSNNGLDLAIGDAWSAFQRGSSDWTASGYWLKAETTPRDGGSPQQILYNVLEGELLVDGKPLGRLPIDYTRNELYLRVFGSRILHVFSSDMPGMLYMSAQSTHGYTVYFGMRGQDLIIKAKIGSQVLEIIPHQTFNNDLPGTFVQNYVHWLDLATRQIEFRPLNMKWTSESDNWRMHYWPGGLGYKSKLSRGALRLVDIRSTTCAALARVFEPLESIGNLHVTYSGDRRLEVALPRYDLRFFLNPKGHLQCLELCRIVDPNQSVGTLIGLKSRLVLCGIRPLARKHDRILIVPHGKVTVSWEKTHVQVRINISGATIRFFQYHMDATLRRLQSDNDTVGKLYIAYLHALTSYILPDPFTERTGTEEAISYLRQRSLHFTKPPDSQATDILSAISALTPQREYYPKHLRAMQQVSWHNGLSMLAQHDVFISLAQHIIASGDQYLMFYPESERAPDLYQDRHPHLLERAKIRNSCFWNADMGGNVDNHSHDLIYTSRDKGEGELPRGEKSFEIASLVRDWPAQLQVTESISGHLWSYKTLSGFDTTYDGHTTLNNLLKLDFSASFGPLLMLCSAFSRDHDTYYLLFLFSTIAYGRHITSLTTLEILLAFAFVAELRNLPVPRRYSYFTPAKGINFDSAILRPIIRDSMPSYNGTGKKKYHAQWKAGYDKHELECARQTKEILDRYAGQWPSSEPVTPENMKIGQLNWKSASQQIADLFYIWSANGEYQVYLDLVQPVLNNCNISLSPRLYLSKDWYLCEDELASRPNARLLPSLGVLVAGEAPPPVPTPEDFTMEQRPVQAAKRNERLWAMLSAIRVSGKGHQHGVVRSQYRDDLVASYGAFSNFKEQVNPDRIPVSMGEVVLDRLVWECHVNGYLESIRSLTGPSMDTISKLLEVGGLWPRLTLRSLLQLLSTVSLILLNGTWKSYLLALGEAVTKMQRARRLVLAGEMDDVSAFCAEINNEGHLGWETDRWPDWLLIEIESDMLIRSTQARVALEMIGPTSSANSLVQLNMGEGKSSVIVPLIAIAVADGRRLSRVIVLKSLVRQMSESMGRRLGGLVDRRICFMPFTRKVQMDITTVSQIQTLQQSCLDQRGILLAQPEHVLSFKLIGVERLTAGDYEVASQLLEAQRWIEHHVRDILDESDELLDVKFQVIYTLGSQRMMDGQPDRWLITQGIFDLVERYASILGQDSQYIELRYRSSSSFPHLRILSSKASEALVCKLAQDIVEGHLPGLHFERHSESIKTVIMRFIRERDVSCNDCAILKDLLGSGATMQKLLLIRGMLARGILLFVLRSKRWSVNYGLHPSRCMSAVPYRAKGVPAPSAEFGHPDVAVALTCLAYYYTGLTYNQMRSALELLQKSDDPSLEYAKWVRRCNDLPQHLRSFNAINLEDERQCRDQLFPNIRYCKKAIDYFLTSVVFPREGKEFDEKLSASSWDIVPANCMHLTTGFSGTNDNRFVLPLSISQQDLPELRHTSGKVLDFVLREENLTYHCVRDDKGRQLSSDGLVQCFARLDDRIRVLIDVGAQVLDTTNREFVKAWMDMVPDADAGIFFDEGDNVMVLTRDLRTERLSASSFQSRMDRCVVYLDEVHTRGTDLRLPPSVRAAVTLGPRLTKDRLVQACMRLRKLAQGQTMMFLAPPEVHHSILQHTGKNEEELDGFDVVAWALEQSCQSIERSQPLRILQGLGYGHRQSVIENFSETLAHPDKFLADDIASQAHLISTFREKEQQRLHDLYAPGFLNTNSNLNVITSSQRNNNPMIQSLLQMWQGLDVLESAGAAMHEEHEREVAHEVEQETQVEQPPKVKALQRRIDPHLKVYVREGQMETFLRFSTVYNSIVRNTSAKALVDDQPWIRLRATVDFANTVQRPRSGLDDDYLRPANWILTSKHQSEPNCVLFISQFEANELMKDIVDPLSGVKLHIYEPRVTKSMGSVDFGMDPPSASMAQWQSLSEGLRRELNLFAGQLYLNSFDDYQELCEDLCATDDSSTEKRMSFVKSWVAIRRKGQDFTQTHVGQMVNGRALKNEAFE